MEDKTYALAKDVEIGVDDGRGRRFSIKEGQLTDLVAGAIVTVRLSVDHKQAQSVVTEGPNLNGLVKSVEPSKNTLTLVLGQGRGGEAGEERTLALAPDAVVLLDDGKGRRLSLKEAKLTDVPVGAAAGVKLSADQKAIASLRAEGPTVPGLLKEVDAQKGTVTVLTLVARGENPEEKTFSMAKDARILIDGNEAKLADLKPEERGPFLMLRLSLDQKTVQGIQVNQRR